MNMHIHSPIKNSSRSGFVLLEIVMALGLFALVAVGLTQALDQIAQTSTLSRQEAQLLRVMDSVLAEVVHQPEFKQAQYDFPPTAEGIRAHASIERAEVYSREKTLLDHLYRIQVNVSLFDDSTEVLRRSIETYVYSPNSTL